MTGFIGEALGLRLLQEGWNVAALVRGTSDRSLLAPHPRLWLHEHDGTMDGLLRILDSTRPEIVLHLASLFLADHKPDQVDDLIRSNLLLPAQLAEAMSASGVRRLVNTGTSWQHFKGPAYRPVNLYAATKQACEDLLAYYHDAEGLSVVTLKLFDTFGPGDRRRKLIRILIEAALGGEHLDMSPGDQVIDLTHVQDVVDGFLIAATLLGEAEEPVFRSYFLSGERHTVKSLVALVQRAIGRPIDVRFGGRPYRPREVLAPVLPGDSERLPGWAPKRGLEETVSSMVS
jgi:nucleoside-diphosphate-sugar epimerase